ncbi:hypothetical protein RN053_19665 [Pantoea dispersa]|uniref:hypothetical protein n=1 Tax=Pantoea dispersa TaxID=59814 RepID=UPI0028DF5789|nr:hypothetical protein [Pantoea dispersa]MDT8852725.1 hypothetical protein [Pantoea dispersa]
MKRDKTKPQDAGKLLRKTKRLRLWSIIGGAAVGVQTLLNVFTRPEEPAALLFHVILAVGCIGYGLSLTPRIRSLSQTEEATK